MNEEKQCKIIAFIFGALLTWLFGFLGEGMLNFILGAILGFMTCGVLVWWLAKDLVETWRPPF